MKRNLLVLSQGVLVLLMACGCPDRKGGGNGGVDSKGPEGAQLAGGGSDRSPSAVLEFPDVIKSSDEAVNRALELAMRRCTEGQYESFRELWSARESPLSEDRFDAMRTAVSGVRILALESVGLERTSGEPETVYVALASMELDLERLPESLRSARNDGAPQEPERMVVLMLVKEFEEWRLAHAPKKMREYIKSKVQG